MKNYKPNIIITIYGYSYGYIDNFITLFLFFNKFAFNFIVYF